MARDPLSFACRCSAFRGHIRAQPKATYVQCFCDTCRKVHAHLTQETVSEVHLLLSVPDALQIDAGQDKLAALTASGKGPIRWFTSCCNTPVANTLRSAKLPFMSFQTLLLSDDVALGRPRALINQPDNKGTKGGAVMAFGVATRMLSSRLTGRWKDTPFFDAENAPTATPQRLKL